jgi:hypothetical protein
VKKAEQRRIIAGIRSAVVTPLKYSSDQRLWVSLGGKPITMAIGDPKRLRSLYPRPALTSKAVPN